MQAYVDQNESARRYVQEIRGTARQLTGELSKAFENESAVAGLTAVQRSAINRRIDSSNRAYSTQPPALNRSRQLRWNLATLGLSMAASVLIVALVLALLMPYLFHRFEVAQDQEHRKKNPSEHPYIVTDGQTPPDQRLPDPSAMARTPKSFVPDRNPQLPVDESNLPDDWNSLPSPEPLVHANGPDSAPPTPPIGVDPLHGSSADPIIPLRLVQGGHGHGRTCRRPGGP